MQHERNAPTMPRDVALAAARDYSETVVDPRERCHVDQLIFSAEHDGPFPSRAAMSPPMLVVAGLLREVRHAA